MAVAVFVKPSNSMLSMCHNFGHKLYRCKNIKECFTRGNYYVIFCVDKQAKEELVQHFIFELSSWNPSKGRDFLFVFGKDTGMKMADMIKTVLDKNFSILTIDAPVNTVFWVEPAMAIILWERYRKCTGTGKNQ